MDNSNVKNARVCHSCPKTVNLYKIDVGSSNTFSPLGPGSPGSPICETKQPAAVCLKYEKGELDLITSLNKFHDYMECCAMSNNYLWHLEELLRKIEVIRSNETIAE